MQSHDNLVLLYSCLWDKCDHTEVPFVFSHSPLASQIRVVLGQHKFNVTGLTTKVFGVEDYVLPEQFTVFNPTQHDIGKS